ncbi:hypothetical protein Kpol_1018p56 [Vanderwaltozyma polyspora DSM 70294]|uniref:t-SNARE affecting a late Golgi compartment protein 1 n=1 Tax=Vanderwaltozyma polyspora (strain ATCC 22028 / DSM 70294 / BCRC 21397 / CBS 2163 / NBRC 10782 / NRRL Y-8283 / UCD 57-17) TaxID=436907 RepID=A7TDQ4_VANPO|nr:uncharacterized protein Kpol_1018p56 [Vanderwaltozyma polyspora DSM 70294]EDO19524.1 hypothetical protein Kpol_1018p56 [Vanderwaltozyma polyspora DSM 70294]
MSAGDEIFEQVVNDAKEQIGRLRNTRRTTKEQREEYLEIVEEIKDTIKDLYKSIEVIKRNEGGSTVDKEREVENLEKSLKELEINGNSINANYNNRGRIDADEEYVSNMEDNNADVKKNPLGDIIQEQMYREQSDQLDEIHYTMGQLQEQARTMGDELRDQSELLENIDDGMDTIGSKLSRGRRQLEWIYEKNREKWNDCCITLLIVVLIILLVMAIII